MTVNGMKALETDEPAIVAATSATKPSDTKADDPFDTDDAKAPLGEEATRRRRSVSISVRGLLLGAVIVALVAAVGAFGWLYFDARGQLDAQAAQSANEAHAEKIGLDYAVNAATMDYRDLQGWHVRLVAGTSPELSKKLTDAGTSMEQVLAPLQWSSAAQPLVAKVRSSTGGVYVVDCFVSVQTKTVQAPEALQSTATYSTTIDGNNNWQITDVGGIGSALGSK